VSERFAACLERFERRDWAAAAEGFAQLVKDDPGNGPAEYLRDVSLRYLATPPPGGRPVIHVASK
jgi:hypothetical protein